MVTRAGARGRYTPAAKKDIPEGLADKWDVLVKESSQRLKKRREDIKKAIGERPYKGLPVSDTELAKRWSQIQHSKQDLVELFQENARFKKDGTVLVPRELIKTIKEQHRRRQEGGFNFGEE